MSRQPTKMMPTKVNDLNVSETECIAAALRRSCAAHAELQLTFYTYNHYHCIVTVTYNHNHHHCIVTVTAWTFENARIYGKLLFKGYQHTIVGVSGGGKQQKINYRPTSTHQRRISRQTQYLHL
jgi:hypothetical protein